MLVCEVDFIPLTSEICSEIRWHLNTELIRVYHMVNAQQMSISFLLALINFHTDKQMTDCFLVDLVQLTPSKLTLVFDGIVQIGVLTR